MGNFEWALTNSFNCFFEREGINALAYRLKQSRFASQLVDILVDSRTPEYYLAIECKSINAKKTKSLYFKQHFSTAAGNHQLIRETDFITKSGRQGILAVELRHGTGAAKTAHLVPWGEVYQSFQLEKKGLTLEEIQRNPPLERKGGVYEISHLDIVRISGYYDLKLQSLDLDLIDEEPEPELE
jgi:hypothetical protein